MAHFDYVLAGGGAAGLSLAYHMVHRGPANKKIAIIDPDHKTQNDRTWCFWIDRPTLVDPVVKRRWRHAWFHGPERSHRFSLEPYEYRMIRGIDFYEFVQGDLYARPNVTFIRDRVDRIEDGEPRKPAQVHTAGGERHTAEFVFDSLFLPREFSVDTSRYYFLKQHFAGWTIRTEEPVFDPDAITLFDLRVPQNGAFRFMYLLSESPNRALVEYTLFSSDILPAQEYKQAIRDYIRDYLGDTAYTVEEEEDGIIPMTDQPFSRESGQRVMTIGTRGGRVKPSTGFAFLRMQQDSEAIVHSLRAEGHPFHGRAAPPRYRTFDAMMLSVLERSRDGGRDVFIKLFERNPMTRVLRFLDEAGTIGENIRLMATVPWGTFIAAWFRVKRRHNRRGKARRVDAYGNAFPEDEG